MKLQKKLICIILILILFVTCMKPPKRDKNTIVFWQLSTSNENIEPIIKEFEQQNPGIKVIVQQLTWANGLEKIITSVATNTQPDVCELGNTWVAKFSDADVLEDITDYFKGHTDDYYMWKPLTYKGKIYGVPWLLGTRVLFYNKKLFKQAGLNPEKPPVNWHELKKYAKKISSLDKNINGFGLPVGVPYAPWQLFMPFVWGNEGDIMKQGKITITDKEFIEALEYYKSLIPYSFINRPGQIDQNFAEEEKIGMMISGAWNLRFIPMRNPKLNYGVALIPAPETKQTRSASFAGGEVLVCFKGTLNKHICEKFMEFLIRTENVMPIVKKNRNVLPSAKKAIDEPFFKEQQKFKVFFDQLQYAHSVPSHARWEELQRNLTRVIEEVILKESDVKTTVQAAEKRMKIIMKN